MKTSVTETGTTVFTVNTNAGAWYIDLDNDYYKVFRNEKFRRVFETKGEAMEYIFEKIMVTSVTL